MAQVIRLRRGRIKDGDVEWKKVDLFNLEHRDTMEEEFFSARLV